MKDLIKTGEQIKIMKEGGEILGGIFSRTLKKIKPGLSTGEVDRWIDEEIQSSGGESSFKRVPGYKYCSCVGVNDEVVHSIPSFKKIIQAGDLLKIDLGLFYKGYNTDLSWSVEVGGQKNTKIQRFLFAGKKALDEAIKTALSGNRIGDLSWKIQEVIESLGFTPVKVLTGHGIGRKLHEDPLIPCFLSGELEKTPKLKVGMTLAIEVIYNMGGDGVELLNDGWTIVTKDGKMSGLFEKTIAVTEHGPLILTPVDIGVIKEPFFAE